ncbi:MAG: class I SAM-dependent methyltransferase [Paraglaciecola sp.]|uniref:SAM-dependent methyltransferase n=1 Tax=Paraglaciecola sp. TaxID=1920173 RepID=UPI003298025B
MPDSPNVMRGVNPYHVQLTEEKINNKEHRDAVGGLWEELGTLQLNFLKKEGLLPTHNLLDMGCGSLRGGVKFVEYLDNNKYFGLDINQSLLDAGKIELANAGLENKTVNLANSNCFDASQFSVQFDCAVAISLFTHLSVNFIVQCLERVKSVLAEDGKFYATFFVVNSKDEFFSSVIQKPGEIKTSHYTDPFHYDLAIIQLMADYAGLSLDYIGDWHHPRNQKMCCFSIK